MFDDIFHLSDIAGLDRIIQADNVAGLELGRNVAKEVWKFYKVHIGKIAALKQLGTWSYHLNFWNMRFQIATIP